MSLFQIQIPELVARAVGGILLLYGVVLFAWWKNFWRKQYKGQLVTQGIYRYIRHPHYSSIIMLCLGGAILSSYLVSFLIVAPIAISFFYWGAVREERELIKAHGEAYQNYMRAVKGRVIPRVF
mgnify:CR=1 FL=1